MGYDAFHQSLASEVGSNSPLPFSFLPQGAFTSLEHGARPLAMQNDAECEAQEPAEEGHLELMTRLAGAPSSPPHCLGHQSLALHVNYLVAHHGYTGLQALRSCPGDLAGQALRALDSLPCKDFASGDSPPSSLYIGLASQGPFKTLTSSDSGAISQLSLGPMLQNNPLRLPIKPLLGLAPPTLWRRDISFGARRPGQGHVSRTQATHRA